MTLFFLIGRPKSKTRNARGFANVGRIEWKEAHTINHINPRIFQQIIEKIFIISNRLTFHFPRVGHI
jgi:hypothetical protein